MEERKREVGRVGEGIGNLRLPPVRSSSGVTVSYFLPEFVVYVYSALLVFVPTFKLLP